MEASCNQRQHVGVGVICVGEDPGQDHDDDVLGRIHWDEEPLQGRDRIHRRDLGLSLPPLIGWLKSPWI